MTSQETDYATWPWETVLSRALGIPVSGRAEVTGQQWLAITGEGNQDPGSHLIWTASWHAGRSSGKSSIRVYLDPSLYSGGAAWDRFLSAPRDALSGVTPVTLVPSSFEAASLALAGVISGLHKVSRHFSTLHQASVTGATPFQGQAGSMVTELLGRLHGVTFGFHDQMTSPVSYSEAVGAAGESATTFLGDIRSAYTAWTGLPAHSPLGSVVQVLKEIAVQDGNGIFTIPDPHHTEYGDLTTAGAWTSVEQEAKSRWTGLLTGETSDFTGLDVLGRTALGKLASQYAASTRSLVPVSGPASLTHPVAGGQRAEGGQGPAGVPGRGGAPDPGQPGAGQHGFGSPGLSRPGRGQSDAGQPGAVGPPGAGGFLGPRGFAGAAGPGQSDGKDQKRTTAAGQGELDQPVVVLGPAGVIGSASRPGGSPAAGSGDAAGRAAGKHFTGTIGRSAKDPQSGDDQAGPRTAPAAGFSLGRSPHGSVLQQSVVPVVSARPPAVRSSALNTQVTSPGGESAGGQGGAGGGAATGGGGGFDGGLGGSAPPAPLGGPVSPAAQAAPPLSGLPGSSQAIGLPAPGESSLLGSAARLPGAPGGQPGAGDMMMVPPPVGRGVPGQQGQSQYRSAYLPEEAGRWGAEPGLPEPVIGEPGHHLDGEPDFAALHQIVGIGADPEPKASR